MRNENLKTAQKAKLCDLPITYEQLINRYAIVERDGDFLLFDFIEVTPDWNFFHIKNLNNNTDEWIKECSKCLVDFNSKLGNVKIKSVFDQTIIKEVPME